MNISQNLENILKSTNHTQKELSEAIGAAKSTINNWIKLGRSIPAEYILPICEFLNISYYQLLGENEQEFSNKGITIGTQSPTITNSSNVEVNGIKHEGLMNELSENEQELLRVFNRLPTKGKIRLMNMVYDYEDEFFSENPE